jgi:hypothetical protein
MNKRIEQLVEEGLTQAEAEQVVAKEVTVGKRLLAEGFKREAVASRAVYEVRLEALTRVKRAAGLDPDQAASVAKSQVDHDEALRLAALNSKDSAEKSAARAQAKVDAEGLADLLGLIDPAPVKEEAKPTA